MTCCPSPPPAPNLFAEEAQVAVRLADAHAQVAVLAAVGANLEHRVDVTQHLRARLDFAGGALGVRGLR